MLGWRIRGNRGFHFMKNDFLFYLSSTLEKLNTLAESALKNDD
jgi:hypothetical protein